MDVPLLITKLNTPPCGPTWSTARACYWRLNGALHPGHRLTVISPQAGFGKTTLLSEWVHGLVPGSSRAGPDRDAVVRIAWLSIEEGDSDLSRFLAYFVAALQTVDSTMDADVVVSTESLQAPPTDWILTLLLNQMTALPNLQWSSARRAVLAT